MFGSVPLWVSPQIVHEPWASTQYQLGLSKSQSPLQTCSGETVLQVVFLVQKCSDWFSLEPFFQSLARHFCQSSGKCNRDDTYYYLYFWNGTRSTRPTFLINRSIAKVGRVDFSFNLRVRHPCADGNGPPLGGFPSCCRGNCPGREEQSLQLLWVIAVE